MSDCARRTRLTSSFAPRRKRTRLRRVAKRDAYRQSAFGASVCGSDVLTRSHESLGESVCDRVSSPTIILPCAPTARGACVRSMLTVECAAAERTARGVARRLNAAHRQPLPKLVEKLRHASGAALFREILHHLDRAGLTRGTAPSTKDDSVGRCRAIVMAKGRVALGPIEGGAQCLPAGITHEYAS